MEREHFRARAGPESEAGFTLIELMMVVLIIAILIAILIPTLAGARGRANDRAMQTSLRNGLIAAKTIYVDKQDYSLATPAQLNAEGVPVRFVDAATPPVSQNEISVDDVSAGYIVMSGQSKSGSCFYVSDDAQAGSTFAVTAGLPSCEAATAPAQGTAAWKSAW